MTKSETMGAADVEAIVRAVLRELGTSGTASAAAPTAATPGSAPGDLVIDLPDPTEEAMRRRIMVRDPVDPDGLRNLCATTTARLGAGRAGPRPRTWSLLLFQADHGVTQDAIYGVVPEEVKERFGLFTVRSSGKLVAGLVTGKCVDVGICYFFRS